MAIFLISYSTKEFYLSQKRLGKSAKENGILNIINFNCIWLKYFDRSFYQKNKKVLNHVKGAGYWLWKPYIILKALHKMQTHDHLLYLDAGIEICTPIHELIKICDENSGILLFSTFGNKNKYWTKRETFIGMNCDKKEFHDVFQLEAGMIMLKKTSESIRLISDWLENCLKFELLNDKTCVSKCFKGFKAHRYDQSILTILAVKYGITPIRSPHQYTNNLKLLRFRIEGEYLDKREDLPHYIRGCYAPEEKAIHNSNYGTLFNLHRTKKHIGPKNIYLSLLIHLGMLIHAFTTEKWLKMPKPNE
ncbi:MAG: hypothetical protein H6573_35025 [Lewinellaceae bacterium]|nr:hypothetical protein [Lewinellaceae bacterium]